MLLEAADEVVGALGQAKAARVVGRIAIEDVLAVLPQAHVEVAAVAGEVGPNGFGMKVAIRPRSWASDSTM